MRRQWIWIWMEYAAASSSRHPVAYVREMEPGAAGLRARLPHAYFSDTVDIFGGYTPLLRWTLGCTLRYAGRSDWQALMFSNLFTKKPKAADLVARMWMTTTPTGKPTISLEGPDAIVLRPFCGPLMTTYAFDLGNRFEYAKQLDQARLTLDDEQLHVLAVEGVRQRALPGLKLHRGPNHRAFTCGGELEATLLLVDAVWDSARDELNDEIVAFAPSKDLLFYCGRNSAEGLAELQALRTRIKNNGDLRLAPDFMLRVNDGWAMFGSSAS